MRLAEGQLSDVGQVWASIPDDFFREQLHASHLTLPAVVLCGSKASTVLYASTCLTQRITLAVKEIQSIVPFPWQRLFLIMSRWTFLSLVVEYI